jgi:hypothetical protein
MSHPLEPSSLGQVDRDGAPGLVAVEEAPEDAFHERGSPKQAGEDGFREGEPRRDRGLETKFGWFFLRGSRNP